MILAAVNPFVFTGGGVVGGVLLLAALSKAVPRAWTSIKVMAKLPLIIDGIAKEFSPNSGATMKDQINRVEMTMNDFKKTYDDRSQAHEARLYNLDTSVAAIRDELGMKAATKDLLALGTRVMNLEGKVGEGK